LTSAFRLQEAYLSTLDVRKLRLLRQADIVVQRGGQLGECGLDPSRASRIIRNASLLIPDGVEIPAADLFPSTRTILKIYLRELLWDERRLGASEGGSKLPFSDALLARKVRSASGLRCSARTIAYCRKELGIPNKRGRARQGCYLLATRSFSALHPLTARIIKSAVGSLPGVYELRLAHGAIVYPTGSCPVFYIGSAGNLARRILAHAGPRAKNRCIRSRITDGGIQFRFVVVRGQWRKEERRIYDRFVGTFGAPPRCNESRP